MPWQKQLKVQSTVVGSQAAGMGMAGRVVSAVCRKQSDEEDECLVVCAQFTFSILHGSESPTKGMALPTTKLDLLMPVTIIKKNIPRRHIQRPQIPPQARPKAQFPHWHPGVHFPGDFRACQSHKTNHWKWENSCSGCPRCHLSWMEPSVADSILTLSLTSFELQD